MEIHLRKFKYNYKQTNWRTRCFNLHTRESLTLLSDESGGQRNQTAEHIHGSQ